MAPSKFLKNIVVILCFERRFSKQNSVIRLKSNILPPAIFGLATLLLLARAVEVNALAQGALRRFTQWLLVEHPTFHLGGGYSTTVNPIIYASRLLPTYPNQLMAMSQFFLLNSSCWSCPALD